MVIIVVISVIKVVSGRCISIIISRREVMVVRGSIGIGIDISINIVIDGAVNGVEENGGEGRGFSPWFGEGESFKFFRHGLIWDGEVSEEVVHIYAIHIYC